MTNQINKPTIEPPPDWAEDWGRVRFDPNEARAAFAATSSPSSAIPKNHGQSAPAAPVNTSGNVTPLGPVPGINLVDQICLAADQRERQQAAQATDFTQMMAVMIKQMETQSQILAALAALVLQPKRKPKSMQSSAEVEP
jgi:hypothetical protein